MRYLCAYCVSNFYRMKNARLLFFTITLLTACGRAEKSQDQANTSSTAVTTDSATTHAPKLRNCQSIAAAGKLGKSDSYQESAKPLKLTLTLNQDTSQVSTNQGCFFNNTVTVQATKKSGSPAFKRTFLKDDLLYFIKTDQVVERSVLQNVVYKPTFNGQKYITLTMQLIDPANQKKTDYTVFMNYFGEILKVK